MKMAYSRMLQDYRRHARYSLMAPVLATDDRNRSLLVTITDIGQGGVGFRCKEAFTVGAELSFGLWLPGARREINIQARALRTEGAGRVGCEFLRIPPVDLDILYDWLKQRLQVKKPLVEI